MDEGVTGEVFNGDEDHINAQIERVIQDEIAPRLIGEDAYATERCWELARVTREGMRRLAGFCAIPARLGRMSHGNAKLPAIGNYAVFRPPGPTG